MNFFSRIFTVFELGIISQQLGIKDFLALGNGALFRPNFEHCFIIGVCLEDRSVFAQFDEIPLMTI